MTIRIGIPNSDTLVDRQFIEIPGPDGTTKAFQYDAETKTLISRESQVTIPSFHGPTHITEDPIPEANALLRGLMSANDKARLDALTQTRLGVLGFQGSGFGEDGGWMQGDIVLAAGSEFISLERVGNIIRFTVDSPISLGCSCEECAQIFWIQDESDTTAIRPPSCNGIMPDINGYGELKFYCFPEGRVFNPSSPNSFFAQKSTVPVLAFTRYENGNVQNTAQLEAILKRNDDYTANVGWAMTPGPSTVVQCKWYMGSDTEGRQLSFEFLPETNPGLLGALLYNGHTITRRTAVITGYNTNVLTNNIYKVKHWSVQDGEPVGSEFNALNLWQYSNLNTAPAIVLDKTIGLLQVGEIVDLWQFELSNVNGNRVFGSYFSKRPRISADNLWNYSAGVTFGDIFEQRDDMNHIVGVIGTGTEQQAVISSDDKRIFEKTVWGITGFDDDLLLPNDSFKNSQGNYEPSGVLINNRFQAKIDDSIPGLIVKETPRDNRGDFDGSGVVDENDLNTMMAVINTCIGDPGYSTTIDLNEDGCIDVRDLAILATNMHVAASGVSARPVFLWHRGTHGDVLIKAKIGRPDQSYFPPYDILIGAPIDNVSDVFLQVVERGTYETGPYVNLPYIVVKGHKWEDLPPNGVLRILTGVYREIVWQYNQKIFDGENIVLVGFEDIFPFDEDYILAQSGTVTSGSLPPTPINTVVAELLHADYTATAVRLQFTINDTTGQESVQLQFRVGKLSMSTPYEFNVVSLDDDYVRDFLPGEFTVSRTYLQTGFISDGIGDNTESDPSDFKVYDGGLLPAPVDDESEKWNELTILKRGNQVWIWWNNLLITPSQSDSASLPTPVAVNTPYFPVNPLDVGKVGMRLWPTAVVREMVIKDKSESFNEYALGQVVL